MRSRRDEPEPGIATLLAETQARASRSSIVLICWLPISALPMSIWPEGVAMPVGAAERVTMAEVTPSEAMKMVAAPVAEATEIVVGVALVLMR